jgi:heat induced stress protein YflT
MICLRDIGKYSERVTLAFGCRNLLTNQRRVMQTHSGQIAMKSGKPETSAVVALYDTHTEAEAAVRELQKSGFDMQKLSIIGKDYYTEEEVVGYYTTGDRMKAWGKAGAFWGGLWGMLFGAAVFMIPGIGPLLAAGPVVGWIVGALEGAAVVGGLSALGAGLFSVGIPKDSVIKYEAQIKAGKFVVVAHGSLDEVSKAHAAFEATKHQGVQEHACCA